MESTILMPCTSVGFTGFRLGICGFGLGICRLLWFRPDWPGLSKTTAGLAGLPTYSPDWPVGNTAAHYLDGPRFSPLISC